ncbi:MAG TPA: hypothetical protein VK568_16825 [Thermodesulfobacteriota bacterium]|jgi:hypothetical protein|nr:hypothetical protein [Thermodesulfobacteriota bacterium]
MNYKGVIWKRDGEGGKLGDEEGEKNKGSKRPIFLRIGAKTFLKNGFL